MKFNLKNRPKLSDEYNTWTERWFEGFEKELREEIRKIEVQNDDVGHKAMKNKFHDLLLKILGEDSS